MSFRFRTVLSLCVLILVSASVAPAEERKQQPDVLLIMPDQMRGDCLSCLDHPVVRTPNLDRIAGQGALFRRAFTTCPSCIPARHALLTGLFPATSGVVGYAARPLTHPTLPQLLAQSGYVTVLVGRDMHQIPKEESYGYAKRIQGSTYVLEDDYDRFLRKAAPETGGIRNLVKQLGLSNNGWQAAPWPLDLALHPTEWIAKQARQVVSATPENKPLFLTASFYAPHPPLFPPPSLFEYYRRAKLPAPAHGTWGEWEKLSTEGDKPGHRVRLEGDVLRNTQAGYFGLIEQLDASIGPLIESFKERSRKAGRPWIILVTADHGEMLGDHGFFRKCEPYEGSANIPFLIAGSSELGFKSGLRVMQPVCLEDIMPTLLVMAAAKPPADLDGVNLLPVLRGERAVSREWLHFEHAPCYSKQQAFHALTDGRLKYIWRPLDGSEQLFNLEKDPREEQNLAPNAASHAELENGRARLVKLLQGRPEGFSDGTNLIPGRPYPALQARSN